MEMAGTYLKETQNKHHKTKFKMEPTGTKEERETEVYLETRSGKRDKRTWVQLDRGGKHRPGQRQVEGSSWWPIPTNG